MMINFNFLVKQGKELHLTTGKKTRIIDIAKKLRKF